MTRDVKIRLAAFVALAAVGMLYIGAAYLGIVDKALGRGRTVTLALPASGGLYVGSEVDYRGVRIGKVADMRVTVRGVDAILELDHEARVPKTAEVSVQNLSAVGEQFVNFVPKRNGGPFLEDGDRVQASADALPPSTDELLTVLDDFTRSVDPQDLETVVSELGTIFTGNAENLRLLVNSGTDFIDEAAAHQDATIRLLDSGEKVLATQQKRSDDIKEFSEGLADLTAALDSSDDDLRTTLTEAGGAMREVHLLLAGLRQVLPSFMEPLVQLNQVLTPRIPGLGQLLSTLPIVVKNNLIGTPGDGYGHISMLYDYTKPVCTQGYLPPEQWPSPLDLREHPLFSIKCTDPKAQPDYKGADAKAQRGVNMVPKTDESDPIFNARPYK
jgi:phospholipid/cholesterol/gamma-HCH transport system substrate-binding protein